MARPLIDIKFSEIDSSLADMTQQKKSAGITNNIQGMLRLATLTGFAKGDSLTYSYQAHDNGNPVPNIQVTNTYPKVLQDLLRKTFKNNNITIINKGTSGETSTQALATFDTDVIALNPTFVILLYGTNDVSLNVDVNLYQSNMTEMVKKCLNAGMEVILVTPPPVYNVNGAKTLYYGKALEEIANVYGLPLVDLHGEVMKMYANKSESPTSLFPDLMHFGDEKYHYIADIIMDKIFDYSFSSLYHISDNVEIPIVNNPYVETDCTGVYSNTFPFFKDSNYFTVGTTPSGTYLRFMFYVDKAGLNLMLKSIKSTNGGKIDVKIDGVVAKTIDFYSVTAHIFDVEDTLMENISFGYHTIEFLANSMVVGQSAMITNAFAYFTSFVFKNVKPITDFAYNLSGVAQNSVYEQFKKIIDGTLRIKHTSAGVLDGKLVFNSDNLELKVGKTLVIESYGNFVYNAGVSWFGKKADNNGNTLASKVNVGYMVLFSNGELNLMYGDVNGSISALSATSGLGLTYPSNHKIRIEHTSAGLIKVFLDDVQKISLTDTKQRSGYCGVFLSEAGTTEITRLEYCYI